ncbi:MFS transporter [Ignavibacteria bacterium 4148-Me]|uniref:MFS transporter n=1 Tax=Rosettibacter primus TaxID=3111523 RepID=UPI00336C2C6F
MVEKIIRTEINDKTTKHNFILNVLDGAIFAFAMSIVSQNTVLPIFVKSLGGDSIAIALIPVVWTVGFNLPQILIANYTSKFMYKKKLLLITGFFQRIFWLFLGIFAFFSLNIERSEIKVCLFFVIFFLAAVGGGFNLPNWFDLISKIIPVNLRGKLFAWRISLGGFLGVLGGYIVKLIMESFTYPYSYSILFFLAFIITMISYTILFSIIEDKPSASFLLNYKEYIKYFPVILSRNKNYRNFMIADSLMILAYTSFAFFTVDAIDKFSLSNSSAGVFTMIMMSSMILGSIIFGYLADEYGHKINLILTSISTFLASLIALISWNVTLYYIVFVFVALTNSLIQVSRLTIIAEMCSDSERAIYAALTNVITVPFLFSNIIAGWIAQLYGFNTIFIISSAISFFVTIWYLYNVKEPRKIYLQSN